VSLIYYCGMRSQTNGPNTLSGMRKQVQCMGLAQQDLFRLCSSERPPQVMWKCLVRPGELRSDLRVHLGRLVSMHPRPHHLITLS
jgi:hypothetical protein